jgi:hypothetical protein
VKIKLREMPDGKGSRGREIISDPPVKVSGLTEQGDWITAVESLYNAARGYPDDQRRVLIVDNYIGGGFQQPFGWHTVQLALYDDAGKRYLYDAPIRVEVER